MFMIKKWILKAVIQKTISFLPFSHKINFLFQKYVTKGVYLTDDYFLDRLIHAKNHIDGYRGYIGDTENITTLELGTGWYPVVPISMFLSGADKILSIDINPLLNKESLLTTIKKFIEYHNKDLLKDYITPTEGKIAVLKTILTNESNLSFKEMLNNLKINYITGDAQKINIGDESVDIIHSNNVFEHIYPDILKNILTEFARVVKNRGFMSHFVDMSDHFAHLDKTITIYNYLKFSDAQWKIIDNNIQPQNRLRYSDYNELYKELNIPITDAIVREGNADEVISIKVHEKYMKYDTKHLAISHCHIYSIVNKKY